MNIEKQKESVMIMYILAFIGIVTGGLFMIAGLIIAYIKRDDLTGTFLHSHMSYYIRTFWFSLLWGAFGIVLSFVAIGIPLLIANYIWMVYRIIKGFLAFREDKGMYGYVEKEIISE
jgi:uncharacterized membrane protein